MRNTPPDSRSAGRSAWRRILTTLLLAGLPFSVEITARIREAQQQLETLSRRIEELTRQQAAELGVQGVRVNAIAPGPVDTAMAKLVHSAAIRRDYHDSIPLGRYGTPEEINRQAEQARQEGLKPFWRS